MPDLCRRCFMIRLASSWAVLAPSTVCAAAHRSRSRGDRRRPRWCASPCRDGRRQRRCAAGARGVRTAACDYAASQCCWHCRSPAGVRRAASTAPRCPREQRTCSGEGTQRERAARRRPRRYSRHHLRHRRVAAVRAATSRPSSSSAARGPRCQCRAHKPRALHCSRESHTQQPTAPRVRVRLL